MGRGLIDKPVPEQAVERVIVQASEGQIGKLTGNVVRVIFESDERAKPLRQKVSPIRLLKDTVGMSGGTPSRDGWGIQ